jgi:hypothetical protein
MTQTTVSAMRLFFLGMFLWSLPGIVPPFLGSWHFEVSIASWLCSIAAVVCFYLAYRKVSAGQ